MAGAEGTSLIKEVHDIKEAFGNHQLVYSSEEVKLKDLKPGDHLAVKRSKSIFFSFSYYHHGIFLSIEEGVVDLGGQKLSEMKIQKTDVAEFSKESTLMRINYHTGTCLKPEATITHAKELIRQPDLWGPYDLLKNNCEHLAIKCKTGLSDVSTQVLGQIDKCLNNPIKRLVVRTSGWLFKIFKKS